MATFTGKHDGFTYVGTYESAQGNVGWKAEVSRFGELVGHVHGTMATNHPDNSLFVEQGLAKAVAIEIDARRPGWDYEDIRALHENGRHRGIAYRVTIWDNADGQYFFHQAALENLPGIKDLDSRPFATPREAFDYGHAAAKSVIEG